MDKSCKRYWAMSEIRNVETNMELLERVLSKENLNNAYKQVYKNKGASGVDNLSRIYHSRNR